MSYTPRTDEAYEAVCFFSTEDEATEALCAMRDKCRELERQLEKYKGLYFTMRELDSSAVEKAEKLERENAALKQRILDDNKAYGCELRDASGTIWDYAKQLQAENSALREALEECVYFADNSQGIVGWHLNGEVFPWDQIEAIDKARAALRKEAQP